ncbi:hypothetical protein B0H19DRAFT_1274801 [Mycena capillaripes]|nr:hypothetical protein B0H19DRAFT_1274801 [Mycena capillaripes]
MPFTHTSNGYVAAVLPHRHCNSVPHEPLLMRRHISPAPLIDPHATLQKKSRYPLLVEATVSYASDTSIPKERGTAFIAAYFVVCIPVGDIELRLLRKARKLGQGAAMACMSIDVEKITGRFSPSKRVVVSKGN